MFQFQSEAAKAETVKALEEKVKAGAALDPADVAKYAPSLDRLAAGEFGTVAVWQPTIIRVLGPTTATAQFVQINLGGGRNNKITVLLSGIDTTPLLDRGRVPPHCYYAAGPGNADGMRVMTLVPFIPTPDEIDVIRGKK